MKVQFRKYASGLLNTPLLPGEMFSTQEAMKAALIAEAKKKGKKKDFNDHAHPVKHCMEENKDKDNPGAYCASIEDKIMHSTDWRGKE